MRAALVILVALPLLSACGLMPVPMVPRPTPEEHAAVTVMWNNMLSPASRLPPETFLDVILYHQLHQNGVDTVRYRSEKKFAGGTVVMEVFYDFAVPLADRFEVRVYDDHHKLLRYEQYSRENIEQALQSIGDEDRVPVDPREDRELSPEERAVRDEMRKQYEAAKAMREHRMREVHLATRPAAEAARMRDEMDAAAATQPAGGRE